MIFRLEYKNKNGLQARLDITTPGSSVVEEIEGAGNPFILSYKGDKSDKSSHFLTSSAEINIYETPEFNIDKLKTSNETQIKVDHYIDDELNWTGFVIPDFFSREIGGAGVVSMTASDRLSTLKGVTLSDLPAMVQIRDLAVRCLARTGLDLPLKTMADFRATDLGFNQYFRSEITSQRLYDSKGRSISCYDILKSILVASGSTLRQRGGEWHIINKLQHEAGVGRVYSTENTSVDYVESVHHFDEIVKGARRTIIPVAGSVGIYHEYGGGKLHPDNYDFSQGLTGWTPVGGFVAEIGNQSVNGYKIESGVYVPDYGEVGLNHLKNANPYQRNVNPIYLESAPISVPYSGSGAVNIEFDINGVGPMLTTQAVMRIAIVAQKGGELLTLHHGGAFNPMPSTNPPVFEKRFKRGFTSSDFTAGADTQNMRVSGTLESSELEGWELRIRIYGGGSSNTILINAASIHMKSSQETPKGAIYKRDQGSDFTKTHDIETAIFGDYLTTGKDGYFYDYPIDDTSSIHNPYSGISSLWTTPYFPTETDALPLLQHVVRQQARMFSVAHDLISGEIEIERFDPLSVFVDCNGNRYVIVSASFDFLRSNVKVELEEIAYANLTVRDFIYSYFGEGESGISSVGGIASGTGGGGTGGGLTPEQIEILSFWKKDPDNPNTIFTEMNAYSKLELSAYGIGDSGGGGGSDYERLDAWADYDSSKAGWVLSAFLGNDLNTRVIDIDDRLTDLENTAGGGTVTSVGISVPTGLSVSNSPITSSGVIAIGLQTGYSIPTTAKQGQWDTAYSNSHTHANKTVLDGITSALVDNWNTAYSNNHTHSNKTVLDGITSGLVSNWNTAFSNTHTHSNKAQLDLITQSNIDVLAKLSIVNGNLQIDGNAYATGELSAYGAGDGGGGGGGIIETVYGYGNLGQTFNNSILTDTFNAYTINQINTRLVSVENGSATTVNTTGTGNAITSISKSGTVITANKDLTFSLAGHNHPISDITGLQAALNSKLETSIFNTHNNDNIRHITGAERTKWDKVVTDFAGLEIGGRNLIKESDPISDWIGQQDVSTNSGAFVYSFDPYYPAMYQIEVRAIDDSIVGAEFGWQWSGALKGKTVVLTKEWQKATAYFNATGAIGLRVVGGLGLIELRRIKAEKGNKATDWTPAPEDQVSDWNTTDVDSFSFIKNKPTTLAGYGITDAYTKTEVNSALISKLDKSVFDDLFEKVEVSTGIFAIKAKYNFYGVGEISAYGFGTGGSGGGSYDRLDAWADYDSSKAGWVLSALLGNELNTRVGNLEGGSALTVNTTGTGNAITSISKSGTVITADKGLIFSLSTHLHTGVYEPVFTKNTAFNKNFGAVAGTVAQGNDSRIINGQTAFGWGNHATAGYALNSAFNTHNNDNVRHITGAERTKWDGVVTDFEELEIGGRNLFSVNQYVSLRNSEGTPNGNRYSVGSSGALVVDGVDTATGYDTMKMVDLKANTEYIFTFNIPINDRFSFYDTDGVAINVARNWNSNNTQLTFKMGNVDGYIGGKFYPIEQSYPAEIYLMAEKGNKATDWTPAPEDQVSDWNTTDVTSFSFIKNKPTSLSQFTDNIGVATHIANKTNPHSVNKAQVGLGNVDNTSDLNKPISNATQNALNLKANLASPAFTGTVTAPTFIGALSGNATSATTLQTARTIWGQSFNGGANVSGAMTGVTTLAMTGALSGATTIAASTSVTTPKVIFNAAGWSMEQVGSELQMKHNNVLKMRFTSAGSIVATEEITAFG